jgi:hypothetical protein
MLPSITPPAETPEQAAARDIATRATAIGKASRALISCIAMTRKAGAHQYYGGGIETANALLASSGDNGASVVAGDYALRQIAAGLIASDPTAYSAETIHNATGSPLPANMDIVPHESGTGYTVVSKG